MRTFTKTIEALQTQESSHWAVGEALVKEVNSYSSQTSVIQWDALGAALEQAGLSHTISTLKAYRRVAMSFSPESRIEGVSFAAHQAALTAGDVTRARAMIVLAQGNHAGGKATRDGVLSEVRKLKGRTTAQTNASMRAISSLTAAVGKVLDLGEGELEGLMLLDKGAAIGKTADLLMKLGKVSQVLGEATDDAEKRLASKTRTTRGKKTSKPGKTPPVTSPAKAKATTKPKVRKMGNKRGAA
jgi:hypothetical protein